MTKSLNKLAFIVVAALAVSGLGSLSARAADDNPIAPGARQLAWSQTEFPSFGKPITDGKFHLGYSFTGGLGGFAPFPNFTATNQTTKDMAFCDDIQNCLRPGFTQITAAGIFDLCSNTQSAPCIDGFEYKVGEGNWAPAKFVRTTDPSPTPAQITQATDMFNHSMTVVSIMSRMGWKANVIPGLPGSATGPHLFELPGAVNSGGSDLYTLSPYFMAFGQLSSGKLDYLSVADFSLTVQPTVVDTTKSAAAINGIQRMASGGMGNFNSVVGFNAPDGSNTYTDQSSVGFAAQFPKDLELRLTLRLNRSLGGWYQGRLENPQVQVTPIDANDNKVVLDAKPSTVPIASLEIDPFDADKADALPILKRMSGNTPMWDTWAQQDMGTGGFTMYRWASYQGLDPLLALGKFLNNKATGYASTFEFKRLTTSNQCMSDNTSFQGLLTTNAMVYQPALPTFSGGEISYKVGGVHYDSNGDLFKGTYNFIMRDSVAKCLYGFTGTAPMQGTVAVTSSDGQENVAYTNVSDRDGWLKLTAQGFTFSNPVITAKLTQEPDPTPVVTPTPSTSGGSSSGGASGKKTTITCVKGKTVKKVTGFSPKCPSGFRQR